jgi:hypothetical protein
MAAYKEDRFVTKTCDPPYDYDHSAGVSAPFAGIYRCMGCGREIVTDYGDILPEENHHSHNAHEGAIRWRLIVYADHDPSRTRTW